jgi:hypothetical protein
MALLKVITKVQTESRELNQAQENIIRVLNPLLLMLMLMPKETVLSTARPTASVSTYLTFCRVKDAGQPERWQVCLQNADGSYGWSDIAMAPL